jgi:purine-cytosine permease-like protein
MAGGVMVVDVARVRMENEMTNFFNSFHAFLPPVDFTAFLLDDFFVFRKTFDNDDTVIGRDDEFWIYLI